MQLLFLDLLQVNLLQQLLAVLLLLDEEGVFLPLLGPAGHNQCQQQEREGASPNCR